MNIPDFLEAFPEFGDADANLIQTKLLEAGNELDVDTWGDQFDTAQGYLAAHKLALSPYGQNAKMVVQGAKGTTYITHFNDLVLKTVPGGMTA